MSARLPDALIVSGPEAEFGDRGRSVHDDNGFKEMLAATVVLVDDAESRNERTRAFLGESALAD